MSRLRLSEIEATPRADNRAKALLCLEALNEAYLAESWAASYRAAAITYSQLHLAEVLERWMQTKEVV